MVSTLEHYLSALEQSPPAEKDTQTLFRVAAIWFEFNEMIRVNELIMMYLSSPEAAICSFKLMPMLNQLVSRLESTEHSKSGFGKAIRQVLLRMGIEHPFHVIPKLLELNKRRTDTAKELLGHLFQGLGQNAWIIHSLQKLSEVLIDLAKLSVKPFIKKNIKRNISLSESVSWRRNAKSLDWGRNPVPTDLIEPRWVSAGQCSNSTYTQIHFVFDNITYLYRTTTTSAKRQRPTCWTPFQNPSIHLSRTWWFSMASNPRLTSQTKEL